MAKRTEWSVLPGDPRTVVGWWSRETQEALPSVLGFGATLALLCLFGERLGLLPVLVVIFAASVSLVRASAALKRRLDLPQIARLVAIPSADESYPVEYLTWRNGVPTGRDRGMATFVGGWLHVEGLRAGFSLRPSDAARCDYSRQGFDRFPLPDGQRIELRPFAASADDRERFQEALRRWRRFSEADPDGEPVLPPLAVHPTAYVKPLTRVAGSVVGGILFALFYFFGLMALGIALSDPTLIVIVMILPLILLRNLSTALVEIAKIRSAARREQPPLPPSALDPILVRPNG